MSRRHPQAGFSLVSAVFLLVIVAMIAAYAVSLGTAQQGDTSLSLLGRRADFAAQSGLDWAIAQVINTAACPASGTSFVPDGPGLDGFTISVGCSSTAVTEGAISYPVYSLTVSATLGTASTEDFARRVVTAQVSGKP